MKLVLFSIVFFVSTVSFASPRLCFVGKNQEPHRDRAFHLEAIDRYEVAYSPPRCDDLKQIRDYSKVLQISLGIGGVVASCSGIGLPVSALISSSIVGLELLNFVVDQIPCDDIENNLRLQAEIHKMLCDELRNAGYDCTL